MTRTALRVLVFTVLPGFYLTLILALGELDWLHCLDHSDRAGRALGMFPDTATALRNTAAKMAEILSLPIALVLIIGTCLPLAIAASRGEARIKQVSLGCLALMIAFLSWSFVPLHKQHTCDGSGADAIFLLFVTLPASCMAAVLLTIVGAMRQHDHP